MDKPKLVVAVQVRKRFIQKQIFRIKTEDHRKCHLLQFATGKRRYRLVKEVSLFDVYRGKNLGEGKKSMAFSLVLHDDNKELDPSAVEHAVKKILSNLKFKLNIEMR